MRSLELPGSARRAALAVVSALLALGVLAPLLGRGFVLSYDMVFVPGQDLSPESLGLSPALPRSVPADAVIALATTVLPGDVVQKLVLLFALFAGPLGAGRLVPTDRVSTRVVAAVAYGWSAYVAERLFIGHWPLLLAYGCLPWVLLAGLALRRGRPGAAAGLVLACAPAVLTPPGGIMVAVAAMVAAGVRKLWLTGLAGLVLNAPWWMPVLLREGGSVSDPEAVTAFAARAENWAGPVTSLLGLGGIWNAETTPASRSSPVLPVLTLLLVAAALFGLRILADRWGTAPARAVLSLGAVGVVCAAVATVPLGDQVLRWAVEHGPGVGLLRDAQKWVAWWAPPLAVGFALAVEWLAIRLRRRAAAAGVLVAAALLPVALLPDLAWGGWGRLAPVSYPDDWFAVRAVLAEDDRFGDVVALPLSTFRRFDWNGGRTQLDPAPRFLPRATVTDDTLVVAGTAVRGEDPRAARVREAVSGNGDLGALGVGWVLVEHGTPGDIRPELLACGTIVHSGQWLSLYRVDGSVTPDTANRPPYVPVLAANLGAVCTIALALLWRWLPIGKLGRHRGIGSHDGADERKEWL